MKTIKIERLLVLAAFVFLTSTIGCSKASSGYNDTTIGGTKGNNEVWLQSSMFDPTSLTVAVNTTVKWTNKDSYAHTVTSDVTKFDSGNLPAGGTFSYQFTSKGTYAYHCNYHSMMKGTIIVQ